MDDTLLIGRRSISSSSAASSPVAVVSIVDGRTAFILMLICLLTFGVYYCYDLPAALSSDFKGLAGGSSTHYELLYSIYSLPNIALPVAGGALSDGKFGPHRCAFAACAIVAAGSALVAFGCAAGSFPLAVAGRFVMGVGGETAFGLQQTLCAYWFATSLQPLAMSVTLTTGNLGEVLNFLATKRLEKAVGFVTTIWLAVVPCVLSALAAAWLGALATRPLPAAETGGAASTTSTSTPLIGAGSVGGGDLEGGPSGTDAIARADYRSDSDDNAPADAAPAPSTAAAAAAAANDDDDDDNDDDVAGARPRTLLDTARGVLGRDAVLLYLVNMAALGNYFLFPSVAADLLHERWPGSNSASSSSSSKKGLTGDDAGFLLAALFAIPMVLAPVFGAIIGGEHDDNEVSTTAATTTTTTTTNTVTGSEDILNDSCGGTSGSAAKVGQEQEQLQGEAEHAAATTTMTATTRKRRTLHLWLAVGCAGNAAGFLLLVALPAAALPPTVGVVVIAIATTVVSASLTPALALAVREEFHGTAFGVWSSSQNVAMTGIALAVGLLADEFSPVASVFFLAMCGAAATGISLLLLSLGSIAARGTR